MTSHRDRAFSSIELLVVVSIIALLIGLLLPALRRAHRAAMSTRCLSNLRNIETAHAAYLVDSDGWMLATRHSVSWIDLLRRYDKTLLMRSPVDTSPYFDTPEPTTGRLRDTTYAINRWVSPDYAAGVGRIDLVPRPVAVIHVVIKVYETSKAVSDHIHPYQWPVPNYDGAAANAAIEVQTDAHGGKPATWDAVSNYGFLDGHASSLPFVDTFPSTDLDLYDPAKAR